MSTSSSSAGAAEGYKTPSPPPLSPRDELSEQLLPPRNEVRRETSFQPRGAPGVVGLRNTLMGAAGGKQDPPSFTSRVGQAVILTSLYPVRFVHVLIQLGHEPVPPERQYSVIFRRYMYYWPGIIGYARAIVRKDGWRELYRGVTGNLTVDLVNIAASSLLSPLIKKMVAKIPLTIYPNDGDTPDNEDNIQTTRAILIRGLRLFCNILVLKSTVTVIVQPFYVVSVRMIAQHVGKETLYDTLLGSLQEIYRRDGVAGFYKGVIPALLGGLLSTVMHVTIWVGLELVAKMVAQEMGKSVIRGILRPFLVSYIPRSYSYPFELMRAVMAANDSGLLLGQEPHTPRFSNWYDAYWHLKASHAMYRGSVFYLSRYAYTNRP